MNKEIDISVILPVYNSEAYIKDAVDSILAQTFHNFELIIINDGAKDQSLEILKKIHDPRIRLIDNGENLGLIKTLNKGISLSSGKYICRMDSDDWAYPDRLEKQFHFLEKNTEIGLVGGNVKLMNEKGELIHSRKDRINHPDSIQFELSRRTVLLHPTVMGRAQCFREFSYDESFKHSEDYDLWTRMSKKFQLSNLDEFVLKYRVHSNSVSQVFNSDQLSLTYLISQRYLADIFKIEASLDMVKYYVHPRKYKIDKSHFKDFLIFLKNVEEVATLRIPNARGYIKEQITFIFIQFVLTDCFQNKRIRVFELFKNLNLISLSGLFRAINYFKLIFFYKLRW